MIFDVQKFEPGLTAQWDDFVQNSENGTLFHQRKFLGYHTENKFTDHSLLIKNKERIVGVIPFNQVRRGDQLQLISHQGSSFGGLVYNNINLDTAIACCDTLLKYFSHNKISSVKINLPPQPYTKPVNNNMEFALLKAGFTYCIQELTSIIDLKKLQQNFIFDFDNKARTNIRKAQKTNLSVSFTDDLDTFYKVLETTFMDKHNIRPTHSLQEIKKLMALYQNEIKLLAVFKENIMIGGTLLFLCNKNVVLTFYLVASSSSQQYRPLNILVHDLVKWSLEKDYGYIDFGTITKNGVINFGLAKFKENFSADNYFRNSLELVL